MPYQCSIKTIKAQRASDNSPIMVTFTYNPYEGNGRAVEKAIADDGEIETGSFGGMTRQFTIPAEKAITFIDRLKESEDTFIKGAVDQNLAQQIIENIKTNTNISLGGMMRVARQHDGSSAELPDR